MNRVRISWPWVMHIIIGVLLLLFAQSWYLEGVAAYNPDGECRGYGEDGSGCPPIDIRAWVLILWLGTGLVMWAIRRRRRLGA